MQEQKCVGKVSYETVAEAEYVMKYVNRRFNKVMNIYTCSYCNKLHLATDKIKSPKKNVKRKKQYKKVKKIAKK